MLSLEPILRERLERAHAIATESLLGERSSDGFWIGELSSSALATATAVSALSLVSSATGLSTLNAQLSTSLRWLVSQQNSDGGWGDTSLSFSNISTTMLVRAAFHLAGAAEEFASVIEKATAYIERCSGVAAVKARYGKDRTFAVPILANCALAGQADWSDVDSLPFELACLPPSWFRFLRLHVVSYALPALIAIGQLIHANRPTWNLVARWIRNAAVERSLRKLEAIQPPSGGFLEAIPLTSFVIMSLAATGRAEHAVVRRGVEFLMNTVRPDGSWPIDSNLSIWLTTLSVNALANSPPGTAARDWLTSADANRVRDWLLAQQLRETHPYTNAAPGGWGWSHLPGSVPDADDTAGALIALMNLPSCEASWHAVCAGFRWLEQLQNLDGGWPTFCRGWGKLPFDRSGADLTAHVIRASYVWAFHTEDSVAVMNEPLGMDLNFDFSRPLAFQYLERIQQQDGSWMPLWFGNQLAPDDANLTYGTARVLAAYRVSGQRGSHGDVVSSAAIAWLLRAQNADGGWGGGSGSPSSIEECGQALEALADSNANDTINIAVLRGLAWLLDRVESGDWKKPSPIGLYFAKLWYFERLYPQIFTVAALGRVRSVIELGPT